MPGVGRIVLAVLLAEAAEAIAARHYHSLCALSGVAPVTRSRGRSKLVLMRRASQARLRNALHHWAEAAARCDATSARI